MSTTQVGNHDFELKHFNAPTFCALCSKFIWGLGKQGYRCKKCYYPCHKKCMENVPADCTGVQKSWFTSDKKIGRVKYAYQSMQDDELTLNVGDQVVVIEQMPNGWCRCEHEGTVGLFPAQYIEIIKIENLERTSKGPDETKSSFPPQTNSNYQTTTSNYPEQQPTETTVVSTPTTATNTPASTADKSRRFTIGAKGETKTLRSVDAAQVDFKKVDRLNKLQEQIETMAKKDFGDLSKAVSKYQTASEGLYDAGGRLSSEFLKISEKYKDSPFATTYSEFGAFIKSMEDQRHQWQKGLNNFANAIKDFEEMRNINTTERAIRDQNKKFDAHVKAQVEAAAQLPNTDNAGFTSALTELNAVCKEIDTLRDQMAIHLEYHKNMLLHKAAMEWTQQMQSHSIFLETVTEQAKHYYPNWRQITATPPQAPPSKWMDVDLKTVRATGSVTTTTTTTGTLRGQTSAQLGAPNPLTPPQPHQPIPQPLYDNNQPQQGRVSLPPPIIAQQTDNNQATTEQVEEEDDEEGASQKRRDRVHTLPSNKSLATATPPRIRQPTPIHQNPTPPSTPPPSQGVWKEYATKEGRKYYYNTATKQTTWEPPLEFRGRTV